MAFLRQVSKPEMLKEKNTPTVISLFTGCGGFDIGTSLAGFETRVMVEWDKHCCNTLRANWFWNELQKRLVSMAKGRIIIQICEEFANSGYEVSWRKLNAADYGVPQNRIRVIMIGKRMDLLYFPEEGNPQLHIGAMPGKIDHPDFFREKHGMAPRGQRSLTECDPVE